MLREVSFRFTLIAKVEEWIRKRGGICVPASWKIGSPALALSPLPDLTLPARGGTALLQLLLTEPARGTLYVEGVPDGFACL